MAHIIAVDIGGTQIRTALFDSNDANPRQHRRIATHAEGEDPFERLAAAIEAILPPQGADVISVAAPGPLDPQSGIVFATPNIPGWVEFPLGAKLEQRFHIPTRLGNDANLAALGEWRYGAGQGYHDLLYLTISTGIGGGVIINDRLLLGARGLAGELGHITVLPDGPLCSCGQRGHLEAVASGPAIAAYVNEKLAEGRASILQPGHLTGRQVAEAARQGDELSREAFVRAGEYLGQALADFLHMFNPSIVILGGGVTQSSALFIETLKASARRHIMDQNFLKDLVITTATLGDNAGLIGALVQGQLKLEEK